MANFAVSEKSPGLLLLSGDLDRLNVAGIWPNRLAELKKAAGKQPVILDLKQLAHVDTAGLAWLINLLRDCLVQDVHFTLINVPQTLINLAKISDVEELLPLQ